MDRVRLDYPTEEDSYNLTFRIIEIFERSEKVGFEDLPPLNDVVDVGALERLIRNGDPNTWVQFTYCDATVRVYGDERIEVMYESKAD